ncbi:phosphatidate cytidylyltransferase [Nitratireductor pacificus]|uniref:Phosphatidate cytidylyltransferase n=1 Tax=Nitratireductor pacificus pht-3B TaxID=391937 RepID=K2MQE9_9HYPH|nr:phosphatidate cytidylyltransferase [Nitratireductor pacificus]EKF19532.1 phosphatidate cytidylyltransferase [Nitratireductor pacificus pht-3B]
MSTVPDTGGGKPQRSNLQLRVMSALVLGAAVLAVTWFGGLPFRVMVAMIAAAIFHEWTAMQRAAQARWLVALGAVLLAVVLLPMITGQAAVTVFMILAVVLASSAAAGLAAGQGLGATAGLAYAAAPALALAYLRGDDQSGLLAILFLFAVVWTTDIMAYFTGRTLGGPKLAPSISPGKTWSGAIGGAGFAVLAGGAFAFHGNAVHGVLLVAGVALLLAVVSELGDLFESALKRRHGIKDSGNLIPGHGGVMDRVDGLMAAALVFYALAALLAGPETPAHAFFTF